ncbi:MAG TPA: hypothetical protein VKS81_12040, partial [Bacteroidota bacterium]|nr:hypothetical protein [Bacteroidota bacterium]
MIPTMMIPTIESALHQGLRELRNAYNKFASIGLVIAVAFHLAVIGSYYLIQKFSPEDEIPVFKPHHRTVIIDSPTIIDDPVMASQVGVIIASAFHNNGTVIPAPDFTLTEDQSDFGKTGPIVKGNLG